MVGFKKEWIHMFHKLARSESLTVSEYWELVIFDL